MTYYAYVTRLKNVRPHPNADRLLLAECLGNQVVVGLDCKEGDLGIYFPSDGVLSREYCKANNLFAVRDSFGKRISGGFFDENCRVRVQKFRGEKSDGYFAPLSSLSYLGKIPELKEGDIFNQINGKEICKKYISSKTAEIIKSHPRTSLKWNYPLFREHVETEQLQFNLDKIPNKSYVIITEKLHGTSGRTSYTILQKNDIISKIKRFFGIKTWVYVSGTRRTILGENQVDGYYKDNFRKKISDKLFGKLYKGETIYYEIVGYTTDGRPIMATQNVEKLKDKSFLERYGKTMTYSYGCSKNECQIYVYRITMTNEEGKEIEYSWDKVIQRCKELGINHVPEIIRTFYDDNTIKMANLLSQGESLLDKRHIREGVVLRIENPKFENGVKFFKYKSFEFKVLEDIIKEEVADIEEGS